MTLRQARSLRDEIRAEGIHCTVPLGMGPGRYCAVIWVNGTPLSDAEVRALKKPTPAHVLAFASPLEWCEYKLARRRPRSPIEMLIDQACGIGEPKAAGRLHGASAPEGRGHPTPTARVSPAGSQTAKRRRG